MDLSNLNPFKKKEEFSLNDSSLPSMTEMSSPSSFGSSNNDFSKVPSLGDENTSFDSNSLENNSENFSMNNESDMTPKFSSPEPMVPKEEIVGEPVNTGSSSHAQQLNAAQMETTLAKVTLIEARLNSIDSKLDILTKLILEEVSEDTKRKLKVDSMMSRFK